MKNRISKGDMPAKGNPDRQSRPDSGSVVLIIFEQGQSLSLQAGLAMLFLVKQEKELAASNLLMLNVMAWFGAFTVQVGGCDEFID